MQVDLPSLATQDHHDATRRDERPEFRVLMVEDNRAEAIVIREMLRDGLPGVQLRIARAVTLGAAVDRLVEADFDVVLLDLGLPDSYPTEVIETIHRHKGSGCALVALTGRSDAELEREIFERGGTDYLVKGTFDLEALARAVTRAVDEARVRQGDCPQVLVLDDGSGAVPSAAKVVPLGNVVTRSSIEDVLSQDLGQGFDVVICGQQSDPGAYEALRAVAVKRGGQVLVVADFPPEPELLALEEGGVIGLLPNPLTVAAEEPPVGADGDWAPSGRGASGWLEAIYSDQPYWTVAKQPAVDVLLVEDDRIDALLVREAMALRGLSPTMEVVEDGRKALAFLKNRESLPSVVLLDLNLPGMNGHQVLERMRADEAMQMVPVVVFSSSTKPSDVEDSMRLGANAFVRKPADLDGYRQVLDVLLGFWRDNVVAPEDGV